MQRIKGVYDGKNVRLLESVTIPPETEVEVLVPDIERLWLDLHAAVTRNHRCATIDALLTAVERYLADRNHQALSHHQEAA